MGRARPVTLFAEEPAPVAVVVCGRCGQELTRRKSRERRYGDDCAEIVGIVDLGSPRIRSRAGGDVEGQGDVFAGEA